MGPTSFQHAVPLVQTLFSKIQIVETQLEQQSYSKQYGSVAGG